jgi:hypothetical protein
LTNEKSRITPEPRGGAPQQNCARAADAEAGAPTSTAAAASTSTTEATLIPPSLLGGGADQVVQ